ncbi:DUF4871 domain-containing protein [Salinibacillus xinjiangensis]|uniref:DUF4871 domain-containing protein n=1 Tax=Salinibacillus xinjiangensis TaxID=1229268 RepID=A0A6G1X5A7_9BACI|nr:DUF4871 domain-containing protein [Salinibacillus xinjiangensis]MRG86008.1 DUF4871 domain-containing protein [Salinibacillus xinjiangensis]
MRKISLMFILLWFVFVTAACKSEETIIKEKWADNSPTFATEYGEMFGKEGSIGIIGSKTITKNGQKWMWHFWGTEDLSNKEWEVKAFKQGEVEAVNPIQFKDKQLSPRGDMVNGHARSSVLFPSSGLWKLQVFIDGELFGDIIVDITQQ